MPKYRANKKTIKQIDDCVYPPVTQWLRAFMDAEFVVCDSFHGAVFSIIFNKPFLIIGNKKRGLTRFYSLLKLYGLEDRIITDNEDNLSVINKIIDWESVNSILNSMRKKSYTYLQQINQ
jgi:exopolysaccharide biosynthesis predicted pyruvyltransferase EpsI